MLTLLKIAYDEHAIKKLIIFFLLRQFKESKKRDNKKLKEKMKMFIWKCCKVYKNLFEGNDSTSAHDTLGFH